MPKFEEFEAKLVDRHKSGFAAETQNILESLASLVGLQSLVKKMAGDDFNQSTFNEFLTQVVTRAKTLAGNKYNKLVSTIEKMELINTSPTVKGAISKALDKLKATRQEVEAKLNLASSKENLAEMKASELAAMQSGDRMYTQRGVDTLESAKDEANQAADLYKDIENTII